MAEPTKQDRERAAAVMDQARSGPLVDLSPARTTGLIAQAIADGCEELRKEIRELSSRNLKTLATVLALRHDNTAQQARIELLRAGFGRIMRGPDMSGLWASQLAERALLKDLASGDDLLTWAKNECYERVAEQLDRVAADYRNGDSVIDQQVMAVFQAEAIKVRMLKAPEKTKG